ncbi:unnamed protein product [Didymodactylos carnosus]|uniref:Anticodon-binding domain-containing protein n=1 Tax=Didymodactylos carnosus TaxID=1234261 RepID=A0A8S2GZX6_9BILA|nr:unnamed protein product [Didymodactylos carnosus]CAF3581248.1 unnamed protein product [Didymodactylos carnosus]
MVHGDDRGLVLPSGVAPHQAVIMVIGSDPLVFEKAEQIRQQLVKKLRVVVDARAESFGARAAEHEVSGVCLRIELGPRDLANGQFVAVRRDTGEKITLPLASASSACPQLLKQMDKALLAKATLAMNERIFCASTLEQFKALLSKGGFIAAP